MSQRATIVVPLPLSVVESNIWDVTSWPAFLADVDQVRRSSHERYVFGIREGRRVHETLVAVRWLARDHRVTWRELDGPQWRGEIRLTPVNGRRTRVALSVISHPRGFLGNLTEMLGGRQRDLELDLHRLNDRLATIPQLFNPTRMAPVRQLGARRPTPSGTQSVAPSGAQSVPQPGQQPMPVLVTSGASGSAGTD